MRLTDQRNLEFRVVGQCLVSNVYTVRRDKGIVDVVYFVHNNVRADREHSEELRDAELEARRWACADNSPETVATATEILRPKYKTW